MSIVKIDMFTVGCDNCKTHFATSDYCAWTDEDGPREHADSSGWLLDHEGKDYCDDCHEIDDDDNITIKTERLQNRITMAKKIGTRTEFTLSESMKITINTDYNQKTVKVIHNMKDGHMAIGIMSSKQDIKNLSEALNELIK